jgi:hypothetical protein
MEVLLVILVLGTFVYITGLMRQGGRRQWLEKLARDMGGTLSGDELSAHLHGVPVRFAYVTRGSEQSKQGWTEIDCTPPHAYPLDLSVRRHGWLDDAMIERRAMVDIAVGDSRFDEAFLVEAAPADVVRILIDQALRDFLLSLTVGATLMTEGEGTSRVVRLSIPEYVDDPDKARHYLEQLARLGARVPAAFTQADAAIPTESIGSPFREIVDTSAQRLAADQRLVEVDRVAYLRKIRRLIASLVLFILCVGGAMWFLVAEWGK